MSCKLIILITVAAFVTLLALFSISSSDSLSVPQISFSSHGLGNFRNNPRTFKRREEFFDLSPAGDKNWSEILPPDGGFVVQKIGDRRRMAGVTMFHQLHCLQMIRHAIQDLRKENQNIRRHLDHDDEGFQVEDGEHVPSDAHAAHDEADMGRPGAQGGHDSMHWVHCLDYLMQVRRSAPGLTDSNADSYRAFFVPLMIQLRLLRIVTVA